MQLAHTREIGLKARITASRRRQNAAARSSTGSDTPRAILVAPSTFSRRLTQEKLIAVVNAAFIIRLSRKAVFAASGANPDDPIASFRDFSVIDNLRHAT